MLAGRARRSLSWLLLLAIASHWAALANAAQPFEREEVLSEQITAMIATEEEVYQQGSRLFEQIIGAQRSGLVSGSPAYTAALLQYLQRPTYGRQSLEHRLIDAFAQLYMSKEKAKTRQLPPATKQAPAGSVPQPIQPFAMQSYDRTAAVQFAYRWTVGGVVTVHPDYVRQHLDCTNFVSQVLRAGGVSMVDYWYLPGLSTAEWWYAFRGAGKADDDWSWAWVNADYLYDHLKNRPLGRIAAYAYELEPGDIVQFDWVPGDGRIDHSAVVTHKAFDGKIYVTYHTNNQFTDSVDQMLDPFFDQGHKVYGWKITY